MDRTRRDRIILLLTIALHIALAALWMQQKRKVDSAAAGRRMEMVWLRSSALRPPAPHGAIAPPRQHAPAKDVQKSQPQAITPPAAPTVSTQPAPATRADDPFAPAPPTAADIVRQAKLDVGKIDKELRRESHAKDTYNPGDSVQAKLERAFDTAHDAVPPKWYEGAKITEIHPSGAAGTSDGAHTRVYRVQTALVTYCITIREDGQKFYTNCPR